MKSIKNGLKRIIALILAIVTVTTSAGLTNLIPTETVYAGVTGSVGGGGTAIMGYTNDYRAWNQNRSGYRFYIINNNLERVSNVLDIVFQKPTLVGTVIKTTRYDTVNSPDVNKSENWKYILYTDQYLKNLWGNGEKDGEIKAMSEWMPVPTTSSAGQGEEFKNWFMYNVEYANSVTLVQGNGGSSNKWGVSANTNNVTNCPNCGKNPCICENPIYCQKCGYIITRCICKDKVQIHFCISSALIEDGENSKALATEHMGTGFTLVWNKLRASFYKGNAAAVTETFSLAVVEFWRHKTDYPAETGATAKNARNYALGRCLETFNFPEYCKEYLIRDWTSNIPTKKPSYMTKSDTYTEDILTTNVPLAEAEHAETSLKKCPATTLLEDKELLKIEGFEIPANAIETGEYYLVVEPIVWLYVQKGSTYASSGHRTYGTYWNILQEWTGSDTGGFYRSYLRKLGNNCMIVLDNLTTSTDKTIKKANIEERNISITKDLISQGYGLSMHIYYANSFGTADTSTCDESQNGTPSPAPDDSSKLEGLPDNPYDPEHKDDEFPYANIVKFYEMYEDGELVYTNSFTREVTPKEILIEDEGLFKVKDWYTSKEFKEAWGEEPRYDEYKKDMKKVKSDTTTEIVELETESTLYVKLVAEQETTYPQAKGDWTLSESRLTKVARTDEAELKGNVLSAGKLKIDLDALPETHEACYIWKCQESQTGHKSSCSNSLCKSYCTSDCHTRYKYCKDHKQAYWRCEKDDDIDCDGKNTEYRYVNNCKDGDGHKLNSAMNFKKGDSNITISVKADDIDSSLRTYDTSMIVKSASYTRSAKAESRKEIGGNYVEKFLIHRGGYDLPQQYTGEVREGAGTKKDFNSALATLDFGECLTSPVMRNLGSIKKSLLLTYYIDLDNCDLETHTYCTDKWGIGCTHKSDVDTITEGQYDTSFTGTDSVAINTYAGKLSGGVIDINYSTQATMSPSVDGFGVASGTMVQQSTKQFLFYPFIQMQYDTLSAQNQKINITGIWQRGMQVNDYAEVAWNSNIKENNLHVTSNQWSTHAKALELAKSLGSTLKNVVLPGGAIYSLDTNGSEQTVQVATYQTILIDEGLTQAEYTSTVSDDLKHATALTEHKDFVSQVKSNLESLHLEQYVSTKATDKNAWQNGKKVTNGSDISYLKNGSTTASQDAKYYLKNDTYDGANEADLDVKELSTSYSYYTFYSTVEGDIYMVKAENVAQGQYPTGKGTKILSKNEDASKLSSSGDENIAKKINTRTLVVDKLVKSVERNTGNDKSASWASSDGHWYNEAFNGVTVVVQKTQLEVGLTSPTVRTTILDPRLIPQQSSKGTLFTTAFLSQYKTSNTPAGTGKPNVIGTFKGRDITLANLDMLFYSNKFYIPDATVQDLS